MKSLNIILEALGAVYSEKKYYSITVVSSIIIYSLNAIFRNFKLVWAKFSPKLIFSLIFGLHKTMSSYSLVVLSIISLATGVLISMAVFLIKRQINSGIYASGTGLLTSIIAPACSSCALGILGLLSLSGLLAILPFKGAEIGLAGIIITLGALFYVSKKVVAKTCSVK